MAAFGLFALAVPTCFGGLGAGWMTVALAQERLGMHAYMAASIFNRVVGFGIMSLLTYAAAPVRDALLPRLMAGTALVALALSEPEAGSDAAAARTRADKTPNGWRINGRKCWISDADGASHLLTLVRTQPGSTGSAGLTLLLVPRESPGLSLTALPKIGNNAMPSWDIGYADVCVDDAALLGQPGEGFRALMSTLHFSRASMAATVTGCAQAALDATIAHATARVQFGQPISRFQAIRHRIADLQMRVDLSRLAVRHLAWLIETGQPCRRQAAQAKITATETLQAVTDAGMQIMASAGYSADSDMQRYWRDARLYSFGEGGNEILRDLIGRELGL
jgi:alkylation response protein AidB-like acyl-CoA dehydrogenase